MKRVIIRNSLFIIITLLLAIFLLYQNRNFIILKEVDQTKEEVEQVAKDKKLSLIMVGDGLIHDTVYQDAKTETGYDFKPMLEKIKPIVSSYDLAFYNQESILGGVELGLSNYPAFNSPYEVGDAFLDAGFNLVSLANNHTLDRGEKAILNSINYWKDKDAYVVGSYDSYENRNQVVIKEINGITYGLLSYTCWTNGLHVPSGKNYLLNQYEEEIVKQDIEKIRNQVDLLMVSMHYGTEYTHIPDDQQRQISNYLASLGVDIIIGHHPHVVQPIEFIGDTLVIYSLGNFLSGQQGIERLIGLMVSVDVVKDITTNKIHLENVEAELTYTYSDYQKGRRGNYKVYPFTQLTEDILQDYAMYYNKYMDIVVHGDYRIGKSDYSGNY